LFDGFAEAYIEVACKRRIGPSCSVAMLLCRKRNQVIEKPKMADRVGAVPFLAKHIHPETVGVAMTHLSHIDLQLTLTEIYP
jgi:hypothetical protein